MHLLYVLHYALMPFLISPMLALFVVLIETVSSLQSVRIFSNLKSYFVLLASKGSVALLPWTPIVRFSCHYHVKTQLLSSIDIS